MSHNPYTPPASPVADPEPVTPLERPRAVHRAVMLLWFATALGILSGIYTLVVTAAQGIQAFGEIIGFTVASGIVLGVSYWIFNAIYNGRNWARITLLVIAVLNTASTLTLPTLFKRFAVPVPEMTMLELGAYVIQFALTIGALVLVFSPSARPWFTARQ